MIDNAELDETISKLEEIKALLAEIRFPSNDDLDETIEKLEAVIALQKEVA